MKKIILLLQFALLCTFGTAQKGTAVYNRLERQYDHVNYIEYKKYYIIGQGRYSGIADENGEIKLAPNKYTEVYWDRDKNCFRVKIGDKMGLLDENGREMVAPKKYTYVYWNRDDNYFRVNIGDKEGVLDENGREMVAPNKYTEVIWIRDKNYFQVKIGDKMGVLDENGREMVAPKKYTYVYWDRDDNYFRVNIGDKEGILDENGREMVAPKKYTDVYWDRDKNCFRVKIGDKMGLLDENGREMVAPKKYTYVYWDRDDNYFKVKIGDKEGVLDENGREIVAPNKYTHVYWIRDDNYFKVKIGDKEGVADGNGVEIIPPVYADLLQMKDKSTDKIVYIGKETSKYVVFSEKGNVIAPAVYDSILSPSESLCAAKKSGKWGFISIEDGSVAVPFEYDKVSSFQDGVAKVTKNGKVQLLPNPLRAVAAATNNRPKANGRAVSTYPQPNSEVDKNIPVGKKANPNTFAFIIANENYPAAKVPYALNDGWVFEEYCKKTLGIKAENVKLFEDATGGNIMACVEQMKQVAKAYDGEASIIFYYAGHAFPDEEKSTAYLLPIDGDSKDPATGYSLERLYKELNSVPAKRVVCFLDACFSGATREDEMLMTGRGVAIKVKDEIPQGNMVVMTSATGAETAHQYEEKGHGLFTYFLLQKLKETKGDVSLEDLSAYIIKNVKRKSVLINNKIQTPTVIPSPSMSQTWRSVKL